MIYPDGVAGWLYPEEAQRLYELARGCRVLEMGSYCGLSTICVAQSARVVYAVDSFRGTNTALPAEKDDTFALFQENLERYELLHKVVPCRGFFADVLPGLRERFDLVFIDGSHDEESVRRDINLALPLLHYPATLVFHDYGKEDFPGVKQAVDERFRVEEQVGSLAVVPLVGGNYGTR